MNRDTANEEYEINLAAFLWELLYRWKMLLIFGIIFGLALAGFKYFKDSRSAVPEVAEKKTLTAADYGEMADELEEEMEPADVEVVEGYCNRVQELKRRRDYAENAAAMLFDPWNSSQLSMIYQVTDEDLADYLFYSASSDGMYEAVGKAVGLDPVKADLKDILSVSRGNDRVRTIENPNSTLVVTMYLCDDWDADKIEKAVTEYLSSLGKNAVSLTGTTVTTGYFSDLNSKKWGAMDAVAKERSALSSEKASLAEDIAKLLDYRLLEMGLSINGTPLSEEDYEEAKAEDVAEAPAFSKKFLILGFVLGIFVYAVILLIKTIVSPHAGYVMGSGRCANHPRLGILRSEKPSGSALTTSAVFYRLHHRKDSPADTEVTNIVSAMEYFGNEAKETDLRLISIGNLSEGAKAKVQSLVKKWAETGKQKLEVTVLPVAKAERTALFEKLSELSGGAVVLLEYDKTKLRDADGIYALLMERKIPVIGCVGVE